MMRKLKAGVLAAFFLCVALAPPPALAVDNVRAVVVKYSQFDAASTTDTVTLYTTTHTMEYIRGVTMCLTTAFAGGSISAYTISIGKSGAVTKYGTATNVFTGATTSVSGAGNCTVFTGPGVERADTAIIATATSTTANLSTATAGQATFYILVGNMPTISGG